VEHLTRTLAEQELRLLSTDSSEAIRAAILAEDFLEFGSSGRVYDKPAILALLRQRGPIEFSIENFRAAELAPGVALATYEFIVRPQRRDTGNPDGGMGAARRSWRSSIFVERGGVWLMRFHQGTPIPDSA
jgi:hypothetical protein